MLGTVRPTFHPEKAAAALQELGYRGKVNDEGRFPIVESAANGARFWINFLCPRDDDPANGFEDIQFDTGFALSPGVNSTRLLHLCNWFNRTYRSAKVSLGFESKPFISLKVDLPVLGTDTDWFEAYVTSFLHLHRTFIEEVIEHGAFKGDGCTEIHSEAVQLLHGPERDAEGAISLYRRAANRGFAGSQNNLGDQYEKGEFLPKSNEAAVYWYTRAAERGEPTAYLSLATLLADTATDQAMLLEAAKFAYLAIENLPSGTNITSAEACLSRLTERLTTEELELAAGSAKAWQPLYQETRLMSDTPKPPNPTEEKPKLLH